VSSRRIIRGGVVRHECSEQELPGLVDAKGLQAELGITRAAAETIMRQLPTVQFEDLRKVYVRRADVLALIEKRTFTKDEVPT
jgi:hypothetical protein